MESFEFFRHPNRLAKSAGKELLADTYDPEHTVEFTPVFPKTNNTAPETEKPSTEPLQASHDDLEDGLYMGC